MDHFLKTHLRNSNSYEELTMSLESFQVDSPATVTALDAIADRVHGFYERIHASYEDPIFAAEPPREFRAHTLERSPEHPGLPPGGPAVEFPETPVRPATPAPPARPAGPATPAPPVPPPRDSSTLTVREDDFRRFEQSALLAIGNGQEFVLDDELAAPLSEARRLTMAAMETKTIEDIRAAGAMFNRLKRIALEKNTPELRLFASFAGATAAIADSVSGVVESAGAFASKSPEGAASVIPVAGYTPPLQRVQLRPDGSTEGPPPAGAPESMGQYQWDAWSRWVLNVTGIRADQPYLEVSLRAYIPCVRIIEAWLLNPIGMLPLSVDTMGHEIEIILEPFETIPPPP